MPEVKAIHEIIQEVIPYYKKKGKPEVEHSLVYDAFSENLEPIYFFILDLMNDFGLAPEKLIDNFSSSPGSAHFSEIGGKTTAMQQQTSKVLADIGILLRGILQLIYDLKDFKMRLQSYDDLKSNKKETNEASLLSLKQIWMDKVDMQKGNSSIKAMATAQMGFQTLIDAFLVAKDEKEADKLDLNDRVKRIVKSRIIEFNIWARESEKELRKRYELEKTYLKSQVNSLKLYSRWVKPYLKTAQELEMKGQAREPALVKTFNIMLLELTLLGKSQIKVDEAALGGKLPPDFQKMKQKRNYYSCVLVDFKFRGSPGRVTQRGDYIVRGRSEITFRAYALSEDDLKKIDEELEKSDVGDVLRLIEGATTESLDNLQKEIDFFLEEDKEKEEKEKKKSGDVNPLLALIGYYNKKEKPKEKKQEKNKPIKPDNWIEKTHIRPLAVEEAATKAFDLFDIYKKAHGMVSYT